MNRPAFDSLSEGAKLVVIQAARMTMNSLRENGVELAGATIDRDPLIDVLVTMITAPGVKGVPK